MLVHVAIPCNTKIKFRFPPPPVFTVQPTEGIMLVFYSIISFLPLQFKYSLGLDLGGLAFFMGIHTLNCSTEDDFYGGEFQEFCTNRQVYLVSYQVLFIVVTLAQVGNYCLGLLLAQNT